MTPTLYLWTLLGVAIVGGGTFFGILRYRFDRKYVQTRHPGTPHRPGVSAAE